MHAAIINTLALVNQLMNLRTEDNVIILVFLRCPCGTPPDTA